MHAPLGIAFWNTRLVPTSTSVPTPERIGKAAELLNGVAETGISFLGLCEINSAVLCELKSLVPRFSSYEFQASDLEDPRWGLGFIHDPEVFERVECESRGPKYSLQSIVGAFVGQPWKPARRRVWNCLLRRRVHAVEDL